MTTWTTRRPRGLGAALVVAGGLLASAPASVLAAAPPATAAKPVPAVPATARLTNEKLRGLQDQAVVESQKIAASLASDIEKLRRRPNDQAAQSEAQRLEIRRTFYNSFITKISSIRAIESYQEQCAREKLADATARQKLLDLSAAYQQAIKEMSRCSEEHKRLRGDPLVDPVTVMLVRDLEAEERRSERAPGK